MIAKFECDKKFMKINEEFKIKTLTENPKELTWIHSYEMVDG